MNLQKTSKPSLAGQGTLILPAGQPGASISGGSDALGYLCRIGLSLFSALSFAVFICEAFGIANVASAVIPCLIFTAVFGVMGISKRFFAGGAAALTAAAVLFALGRKELAARLFFIAVSVTNAFFRRLESIGYAGMGRYVKNFDFSLRRLGMSEKTCLTYAMVFIAFLLSALFCACLLRRVHMLPMLIVGSAICTLLLYYGMPDGNIGFAMIIASVCGIIALESFDRIYTGKKTICAANGLMPGTRLARREYVRARRQSSAMGGFIGLGSALMALILLILPAGIKKDMDEIPAISVPAMKLENFAVALVNGRNPDLGSLIFSGVASIDSRSAASRNPRYSGDRLFAVGMDTSLPVYLRNWVGSDYRGDYWYSADYDEISEYKRLFGEDFSPERLTGDLLRAVDPALVELPEGSGYRSHSEYGYVTARVDIRKLRPTANLLYLPSYTDQRTALLVYGTREPSSTEYESYYDGLFASTPYLFLDTYSVIANLPLLRDADFAANLSLLVGRTIRTELTIISALRNSIEAGISGEDLTNHYRGLRDLTDSRYGRVTDEESSLAHRFAFDMDSAERRQIIEMMDHITLYRDYVYKHYLTACEDFQSFTTLAANIVSDIPVYADRSSFDFTSRHESVMEIIDYLSKNMTYTLTPKEPTPGLYANSAASFLFDTREGYCVQFATSAVMLLRSLGIPARYAEGYIAQSFTRNRSKLEPSPRYTSTVVDSNAHAWIEVYYDYYGWVQYEATTPYMAEMYEGSSPASSAQTSAQPIIEPEPEETSMPEPILPSIPQKRKGISPAVVTALSIAAVAVCIAAALAIRAARADKRFNRLLKSAAEADSAAARIAAAKPINARIFALLALSGLSPSPGEMQSDFADRVDLLLAHPLKLAFRPVSRAIQRAEFSPSLSPQDLALISAYFRALRLHSLSSSSLSYIYRRFLLGV